MNKIIVIGAGPGGYMAAIRAAQLNNEVILVEKDELGGTCLNRGCIPTKSLIQSADVFWEAKNSATFGVTTSGVSLNFSAVMNRKEKVVKQLITGCHYLMKKNKINVIKGIGTILDPKTVKIADSGETLTTDNIIIATGSIPSTVPIEGIDSEGVINSNEALQMQKLPESIAVIGGGVIGIEFAQIMQRMGVKVTVIEMMPQILPTEDTDMAKMLENLLVKEGIEIVTDATVKRVKTVKTGDKSVSFVTAAGDNERIVNKVLISVGRRPDTSNLGLEKLGVNLDKGRIIVDERMQTNILGIYAVGDVLGRMMLAHSALAEGRCAAENVNGASSDMDYQLVSRCIYTSPEMAGVGLTEAQAKEKYGSNALVGKFPFMGNAKALILNETDGLVKVVAEAEHGKVLGVEILGPHVTELIAEAVLGMRLEMTFDEMASAIQAHPTVSEALMEAALNVRGKAISI
jgi:dihydrolipoamide dehydrogenase